MIDANAEYVQRLRVPEDATNEQIQTTLHKLFDQGPQGKSLQFRENQGPQGHTVLTKTSPQGTVLTPNEGTDPQGTENEVK